MLWKRPDDVPFPTIWHRFERSARDGTTRKFYIQDATDCMDVFLIDHMKTFFCRDEVLCKSLGLINYPHALESLTDSWRKVLNQRITLVCFEEDAENQGKPLYFAGCLLNYVICQADPEIKKIYDEIRNKIASAIKYTFELKDVYKEFNIDRYITDIGMSVVPSFRGMNIGAELLTARLNLSRKLNIKYSISAFTGEGSQSVARKAGYKDLIVKDYEEIARILPKSNFPGLTTKSLKIMYQES